MLLLLLVLVVVVVICHVAEREKEAQLKMKANYVVEVLGAQVEVGEEPAGSGVDHKAEVGAGVDLVIIGESGNRDLDQDLPDEDLDPDLDL